MIKKVLVKIKNSQKVEGETSEVELISEGEYEYLPGKAIIRYKETGDNTFEGTDAALTVEEDNATLIRKGSGSSEMTFKQGIEHRCDYRTPYGSFKLTSITKEMKSCLTESGGKVSIVYLLYMEGAPAVENSIQVTVDEI